MTIVKGSQWGVHRPFPVDAPVANSNRDLHRLVRAGERLVGLTGGDLYRTVGGSDDQNRLMNQTRLVSRDPENLPIHLPVDLIEVSLDDRLVGQFSTHLVGHDPRWRHVVAAMNCDFWRAYRLGPRAHPNDGVIDTYVADLPVSDLLKVLPRARTGLHVPHPAITLSRSGCVELTLPKRLRFAADDVPVGRGRLVRLTVLPDALTVVI
jgi:hypothetical protein